MTSFKEQCSTNNWYQENQISDRLLSSAQTKYATLGEFFKKNLDMICKSAENEAKIPKSDENEMKII